MIIAHVSRSFRDSFPGRASEWALATMLFNWSLILTLNDSLFAASAYQHLAQIMTQPTWAALCGIAGGGRLVFLVINGAWRRSPHLRAVGAFVATGFWMMISIGILQAGTLSTELAIYPVLTLLDSFNVIRAMGEAGISDVYHSRGANKDGGKT